MKRACRNLLNRRQVGIRHRLQFSRAQNASIAVYFGKLLLQHVSGPLAEWLTRWPATGGSAYERLQLALRRIPTAVGQLQAAVARAVFGLPT